ncbi:GAF domain-containing protein [Streptomyces sp. V4I2]|uniref:GAF domain-containing protein n=1 Tax=Streptomyces sp. V4I2 TaxID=3042280 RepID=UPI0027850B82|nr:GAF domain-containing protein [Streptomyces sp. V4I2]MDQ1042645.1 transcriptional regulator with GAF, ATPase, and Fis domain [Streptomyces sp. V4I2]
MTREEQLTKAFVGLADTLADGFDPVVLLDRLAGHCIDLTGADAVGVTMATTRGDLRIMAVAPHQQETLTELVRLQAGEGPARDCYRTRRPVNATDLSGDADNWSEFAPRARQAGYRAAHSLPLRVNHHAIGAVTLLLTAPGGLPTTDLRLAQALADVAAVALVHWSPDPARPMDILTQAQAAVAAKATVEMAQGMLAEYGRLDPAQAMDALHAYCCRDGDRLTEVAQALVRRTLAPETVLAALR